MRWSTPRAHTSQKTPMSWKPETSLCRVYLWIAALGFGPLVVLCTFTNLDVGLSAYFYDPSAPEKWFLKHTVPWIWLFRFGEYAVILPTIGAAVMLCGSLVWRSWARYRQPCLVLVLAVVLGPGVLVNGILKPFWGRVRPVRCTQFDGVGVYHPWWQPGGVGFGNSFPSGHAAIGYVSIAAAWMVPERRSRWRRLVVAAGLAYGTLLGVTRIIQGGHFASDVLWSGLLMCVIAAAMPAVLRLFPSTAGEACTGHEKSHVTLPFVFRR
jgi:lipid A 4'-phosphatase